MVEYPFRLLAIIFKQSNITRERVLLFRL